MKIHFLGSAASEGIPNPFCSCELCERARKLKGHNIRTRSSAIIDDVMQIDISPEFSHQIARDDIDARKITDLLFTHTHPDHFNVGDLFSRMEGYGHHIDQQLNVFGNDIAISGCIDVLPGYSKERFQFNPLVPFVTQESHGYRITPLLANHAKWEFCYVYFIEKQGKTLFYGHDSGWFPDLTWQWLAGRHIDLSVLECTFGYNGNTRTDGHMSLETVLAAKEQLKALGCYNEHSQLVISHISHSANMTHEELVKDMEPHGITVAFDGQTITL